MIRECSDLNIINELLLLFNQPKVDSITSNYKVFEQDNKILGFINYKILYDEAELYFIFVFDEYRKTGIGSKLLNHMINDLIDNKCNKVFLEVRKSNTIAFTFYTKNDFKTINLRKDYYKSLENNDFEDAIIMERRIGD